MIARIWRGVVQTDDAEVYGKYIDETGFSAYKATAGNAGAWLLRRDDGGRTEFLAFTLWDSTESIKAFAGEDIEAAVYYPEDEKYLIEGEDHVRHFEVIA
jgi:heme-degrading monooxygenase HmoA